MTLLALIAKNRVLVTSGGSAPATEAWPVLPAPTPLQLGGAPGYGDAVIWIVYADFTTVFAAPNPGEMNGSRLPGGGVPSVVRFGA